MFVLQLTVRSHVFGEHILELQDDNDFKLPAPWAHRFT